MEDAAQTKPLCVVLDTNVWLNNPLLKDPLGAALLFSIRRMRGYIGMPEVIEEEIIKNVVKTGVKAVESINTAYRKVLILMGSADDYQVPSEAELEESAKSRLQELDSLLRRVPFTLEHAKSALKRVNDETPPNGPKNQQFKDSAIWEAVTELSETYRVHFVTEDKGFFEGREIRRGLALALKAECESKGRIVLVHSDLTSLLSDLREAGPALDTEALASVISENIDAELTDFAISKDYLVFEMQSHNISAFLTENSDTLAISFELRYEAVDVSDENNDRMDYVIAKGNCLYDFDKKTVSDVRLGLIEYHKSDGDIVGAKSRTTIFGVGGITLGRKRKSYRFQEPLI
jgi:hypothetical protein